MVTISLNPQDIGIITNVTNEIKEFTNYSENDLIG